MPHHYIAGIAVGGLLKFVDAVGWCFQRRIAPVSPASSLVKD
jgi:hypothetical protein